MSLKLREDRGEQADSTHGTRTHDCSRVGEYHVRRSSHHTLRLNWVDGMGGIEIRLSSLKESGEWISRSKGWIAVLSTMSVSDVLR